MKLEINEIKDEFPEYKTNVNTDNLSKNKVIIDNLPKNKVIIKNNKVIHHDHCLHENNILSYILSRYCRTLSQPLPLPVSKMLSTKFRAGTATSST